MEVICDDVEFIEDITNTSTAGIIPWVDETTPIEQIQQIQGLHMTVLFLT